MEDNKVERSGLDHRVRFDRVFRKSDTTPRSDYHKNLKILE